MATDPVRLALVQNRLDHIARQMGWVMTRTARSPIFSQSHDFSCFLADETGVLLSQADGVPIHTGCGGLALQAILTSFEGDIAEEDVFLLNDPYVAGGNHLPDWVVARPVFHDGRRIGFACNRAHQSDIGGGAAGTFNPEATEIFQEGLRLPPLKVVERGRLRQDLWNLLLLNTRTPDLLDGDLRAMLGSTRIGMERMAALVADLGPEEARTCFADVLNHGDRVFRAAVAALPDGLYEGEDVTENDCFENLRTPIRVAVVIAGDRLSIDFAGTGPQMRGFKNSSYANSLSAAYMALGSFFDAPLPRNEGTYRSVDIHLPEGSAVNPRAPAPTTLCTIFIAHHIIHAVWQALGQAMPRLACAGWGKSVHPTMAAHDSARGRTVIMHHWLAMPGGGAVAGRDGFAQVGHLVALGGLYVPNAEDYEQLYPVRFLRQELRCDAGGAGEFRGGPGVDYAVEILEPSVLHFRCEGVGPPSGPGAVGGGAGEGGSIEVIEGDRREVPPSYGTRRYGPAVFRALSPGGGGWGDPRRRTPERVVRDVRDGIVSREAARDTYGVVLGPAGEVDAAATAARRHEARAAAR